MRKLIVGVDPGTITAVALLDIDSDFVDVVSRRDFSLSGIAEYIVSRGDPVIVATDKKSVPDFVHKTAATFNARIVKPENNLTIEEKESLTKKYRQHDARSASVSLVNNDHEQDALAAAVYAKKRFAKFLQKVDTALEKKGFEGSRGDVKELLLKGEVGNIEQALKLLAPAERRDTKVVTRLADSRTILELRKRIETQQKENTQLRARIEEMEKKLREIEKQLREEQELRKKITVLVKEKSSVQLSKETELSLAKQKELEKDYYVLVQYEPGVDVKDKIVIVDKRTDINAVAKKEPRAIIADKEYEIDVPVIVKEKITIKNIEGFLVADKDEVDAQLRKSFISFLQNYKSRYEKIKERSN